MIDFLSSIGVGGIPIVNTFAPLVASIKTVTGTTYTILSTDSGKIIEFTNAGAVNITCPTGLTVGFQAVLVNVGGDSKSLVAGTGATIYSKDSKVIIASAYNAATIYYRSINKWVAFGNLT